MLGEGGGAPCVYLPVSTCHLWMYVRMPQCDPSQHSATLLCLHRPPLTTHQLLLVCVAIGLLSTSIHLCPRGRDVKLGMINQRQVNTPEKQHHGFPLRLHTLPRILHGCHVETMNVWGILKAAAAAVPFLEHEPRNTTTMCYLPDAG